MQQNLQIRFLVIAIVLGFLGWKAVDALVNKKLQLGIDLEGGSELVFRFDFGDMDPGARRETLNTAIGVVRDRIDRYGLKEIILQPIGDDRFSVEISARDRKNVDTIKEIITQLGKLEFRITVPTDQPGYEFYWERFKKARDEGKNLELARTVPPDARSDDDKASGRFPEGLRWYELSEKAKKRPGSVFNREGWTLCRLDRHNIGGEQLTRVRHGMSTSDRGQIGGGYEVDFGIDKLYQNAMAELTATVGDHMAIILNDRVDSAPVLRSTLSDSGQITGDFTEEEARALAAVLQAGALKQKPELVSESTIAAELAGDARDRGIWSTVIAFGIVLAVMIWYYYGPGWIANLALLLNLVLLLGVVAWFGQVLTLPGIAGVVLTIGMAVDANILIYERLKEEKAKGRTIGQAVGTAYDRALVTIIDSNLTTLITAYFLFQVGSGPVRGFGVTLTVGIIASMFTAIYVTRTLFLWMTRNGWIKEARMRKDPPVPNYGWMRMRAVAGRISVYGIVIGLVLFTLLPDTKKYDVDFTQGSKLIMRLSRESRLAEVQGKIADLARENPIYGDVSARVSAEGIGAAVAQESGTRFEFRSQQVASRQDIDGLVDRLRASFAGNLPAGPFKSTLEATAEGGTAGTLHFMNADVDPAFVREALRQYFNSQRALEGARVEKAQAGPGAISAVRVILRDPISRGGETTLHVRRALDTMDLAEAVRFAGEASKDPAKNPADQKAAADDLALFGKMKQLPAGFFDEADPFPMADRVDPFTAREHRDKAVQAMVLSLFGIIVYVAFRFRSWSMGFAAVIALIHDVLMTLGFTSIVNWFGIVDARLNLVTVAAYLTLIGYSINDTIVIFDRIRENRGAGRSRVSELIDKSVNQTLSRTIRTSLTVFITVVVLFVMNLGAHSALVGFAFIMTFGAIVGTYSTVYIASPMLLFLPWMWMKCGSTVKGLLRKHAPVYVAAVALLLLADGLRGKFGGDISTVIFSDLMLGIPLALGGVFVYYFLRWLKIEDPEKELAAA